MITDPYKVLGISRNATSDEVKKAYRELSKKYHPDSHMNNPLSDLAEDKFKEVQAAYDQIMNSNGNTSEPFTSANSYHQQSESAELYTVYQMLTQKRFYEALRELEGVVTRTGRWFYYSAIANQGVGNSVLAFEHARQAVALEPRNLEYQNLVNQLQFRTQRYQTTGNQYGRSSMGTGNLCCDLLCADALCECMGGDLISCC